MVWVVHALDEWLETEYEKHIGSVKGSTDLSQALNESIEGYRRWAGLTEPGLSVSLAGALPSDTFVSKNWTDEWDKGVPVECSITATLCDS